MVSEQEEDEILLLPQAQLGNTLTSVTLDFTFLFYLFIFLHSRTSKTVSPPYSENTLEHRPGIR